MISNKLRVSFVVIAYNEEDSIAECLKCIQKQPIKPFEVILVDNYSTDMTVKIAREFNFVDIITEKEQGILKARLSGFNKASGDLIVAIDADTLIDKDYVEKIISIFQDNSVSAVTGYGKSRYEYIIPNSSIFWSWCYFTFTKAYFGYQLLWGANMAIRRKAWLESEKYVFNNGSTYIHDDQEISLALATAGFRVKLSKELTTSVDMESVQRFSKFHQYVKAMINLKQLDKKSSRPKVETRLPRISIIKRFVYFMATAWTIIVFYVGTIFYSSYLKLKEKK